jgi:hypothetical protein
VYAKRLLAVICIWLAGEQEGFPQTFTNLMVEEAFSY